MSFSLKLLGGAALAGEHGLLSGPAVQRHRLALLALLALARPRAVSRDKLVAWLWPERETEPARRLLNQAVHTLRQALGAEAILSAGDDLQLDTSVVPCDAVAFEDAVAAREPGRAVTLYTGPFLDGFFLDEAEEFERWVDRERDRLAAAYAKALEGLAEAAEQAGDSSAAVERWRTRAAHDPYDSGVALRLMQALERAGNRAGALHHATLHQQRLREELEIEPAPEIQALVERLRREAPPAPAPKASEARKERAVRPPSPPAKAVAESAAPQVPPAGRVLWYAAAVILLATVIGGAVRLAARNGESAAVATPQVVDQIALAVARELTRRERGDTARSLPQQRTHSLPAYELYLRGMDPALLRSDSGARRALEYFRHAVALDSTYAAAWAGVARMLYRTVNPHPDSVAKTESLAETAARKALALDDSLAEAHATLAMLRATVHDNATAEQEFKRAIALDPGRSRTHEWFAQFYLTTGRPVEALAEAERASTLEPLSATATAELARALAANDRCDEALARLKTIAALDPPLLRVPPIIASCEARQGRWAEAIAALRPGAAGGDGVHLATLGYLYARAGQRETALSIQARLLDRWRSGAAGAYLLAFVPAGLGDRDVAFAWLDRAVEDGSLGSLRIISTGPPDIPLVALQPDPRLDRLRNRWQARLRLQNR